MGRPADAAARFLQAARTFNVSLEHMWASEDAAGLGQACLIVPQAGRTGMVFTSRPVEAAELDDLARVLAAACEEIPGVRLAQGLLEPEEADLARAYEQAGFLRIGDLHYLRRNWTDIAADSHAPWPEGVEVRSWRTGDEAALMRALERSYEQTLDCPELCGLRELRDVVDSHKSTGRFDPALWWLVLHRDAPAGALLLSPCPDQGHVELVYLGVAPELRGAGVAGKLLRMGLGALAERKQRTVTCAVDARNDPAMRLYTRHGFERFSERLALVRGLA
ncbi:MAG: GNAT family N-acetyltransferase [Phycisphaeraceae bacterium]|nr:MAG: GNAT family N-acetyltransferase [Phycisphaeraceae bacterium]